MSLQLFNNWIGKTYFNETERWCMKEYGMCHHLVGDCDENRLYHHNNHISVLRERRRYDYIADLNKTFKTRDWRYKRRTFVA